MPWLSQGVTTVFELYDRLGLRVTYEETVQCLMGLRGHGVKLGLENVLQICQRMGNPQDRLRVIHVAGTNGKGSVIALMASILRAAGLRVGVYTSPHLVSFRERIRIDDEMITEGAVVKWWEQLAGLGQEMTFFEATTVMALAEFAEQGVDWVLLETGMGGRLDATNVVEPQLCVITNIGFDHMKFLGDTLPKIAKEKAGILKQGVPVVIGELEDEAKGVIVERGQSLGAEVLTLDDEGSCLELMDQSLEGMLFRVDDEEVRVPFCGLYQFENVCVAVRALRWLRAQGLVSMREGTLRAGLEAASWQGRFQILSVEPVRVLDGGHNRKALEMALQTWRALLQREPEVILFSCQGEGKWDELRGSLDRRGQEIWLVPLLSPQAIDPREVAKSLEQASARVFESVADGWQSVKEAQKDVLVVGSLYLVGEILGIENNQGLQEMRLNWWFK